MLLKYDDYNNLLCKAQCGDVIHYLEKGVGIQGSHWPPLPAILAQVFSKLQEKRKPGI